MSYIINNSRGQIVAVVGDGTVNTVSTDLSLIGRAVTNYGEYQNENYVYLLENFAAPGGPAQPILGQLWYNSQTDVISAYSTANAWMALASQDYVQAQKVSPAFTGTPTAPTATVSTNSTQIATTAFVQQNKLSPAFSGVPTAPTAPNATSSTQIATTAFVANQLINGFTSTGTITANGFVTAGTFSTTGNVVGGNLSTTGNIASVGAVSAAGNITGGNIIAVASVTGNTVTGAQIVSVGNVTAAGVYSTGVVSAAGNIIGANISTQLLTVDIEIITANVFADMVSASWHTGTTVSVTGQITGGNITASGNITANNIIANTITASGNSAFRIPNLTQTQINALSANNGDMVYNTTTNLPQIYQSGSWRNFTISYYS